MRLLIGTRSLFNFGWLQPGLFMLALADVFPQLNPAPSQLKPQRLPTRKTGNSISGLVTGQ